MCCRSYKRWFVGFWLARPETAPPVAVPDLIEHRRPTGIARAGHNGLIQMPSCRRHDKVVVVTISSCHAQQQF